MKLAIVAAMVPATAPSSAGTAPSWRRRLVGTLLACLAASALMALAWQGTAAELLGRWLGIGLSALAAFELAARWPRKLPRRLPRWSVQLAAVGLSVPTSALSLYTLTTLGMTPPWWQSGPHVSGLAMFIALGLLIAPWMTIAALMNEVTGASQRQALAFDLERSEYERQALDAKLRLLQAQVEPHFLFNTLANVRELVDSGSPQASAVLGSLIAYLRAAVPRLQDRLTTMGQELELVRSYLELMHLRMPDRLVFSIEGEPAALTCPCPPSAILTLVENAIRHGIDPSERGGEISVQVSLHDGQCRATVRDTGLGLGQAGSGLGTGLATLRERLRLTFSGAARLEVRAAEPRGVLAELTLPDPRRTP